MKHYQNCFYLFFVVCCLLFTSIGCSSGGTAATSTIPAATAASSIGYAAKYSVSIDNSVLGVVGSGISSVKSFSASTPGYGADGWWSSSDSFSLSGISYSYNYKFRVWNSADVEITTTASLDALADANIKTLWTYSTMEYSYAGDTFSIRFGNSTSDPLKFNNLNNSTTKSITGPITYTSTYNSVSYDVAFTYADLSLGSSGYPSGSVSISVAQTGSASISGTITFDGTNTATLVFTSGVSGTYAINLDTGAVTAAGL